MEHSLQIQNGIPLYSLYKIAVDFKKIICSANKNSISFMSATNYLSILLTFDTPYLVSDAFQTSTLNDLWDYSYIFNSDDVRKKILWFKNKANAEQSKPLNLKFFENFLQISNNDVNSRIDTLLTNPPLINIPTMDSKISAQMSNLRNVIRQIDSISDENISIILKNHELSLVGADNQFPSYNVKIINCKLPNKKESYSTSCYRGTLLSCFRIASSIGIEPINISFYPSGATQLNGKYNKISFRSLLVTR